MSYQPIRDVLKDNLRFHRQVRNYMTEGRMDCGDAQEAALSRYLQGREEALRQSLAEYDDVEGNSLDVWLQYTPEQNGETTLEPGLTAEQLLDKLLERSQNLIESLDKMSDSTAASGAQRLLQEIKELELNHRKKLSTDLLEYNQDKML